MKSGQKYSRKREAMLKLFRSTTEHPSAEWIYARLKDSIPDLSLGTVYRNIAVFRKNGEIVPVCVVNGQERFDGDTTEHGHLICLSCGAVTDIRFEICDAEPAAKRIFEEYGFRVTRNSIVYYGTCKNCTD